MRSNTVSFRGVKQVLDAYTMQDMSAWSIWNGKDLMFAYEGDSVTQGGNELRQTLDALREGGSQASYSLKVYEDLPKKAKITSSTPYSRALSFSVFALDGDDNPYQARQNTVIGALEARFTAMQEDMMGRMLKRMDEDDKKKEEVIVEKSGIGALLNGLLEMPEIKQAIAMGAVSLMSKIMPMNKGALPAKVAGTSQGETVSVLNDDQVGKVQRAIDILCTKDPALGDHLLKVAELATNSPNKYKMFTGML